MTSVTPTPPVELAFPFLRANERPSKPRARGVTEIRGPYYSVMGPRYLTDVLDRWASTSTRSSSPVAHSR